MHKKVCVYYRLRLQSSSCGRGPSLFFKRVCYSRTQPGFSDSRDWDSENSDLTITKDAEKDQGPVSRKSRNFSGVFG